MNGTPATEDRIWAVFSHLSALAFGMGILFPIIGWSDQRRKSNYASFQCLQALGYQSLGYTIWILLYLLAMVLWLFVFVFAIGLAGEKGSAMDTAMGIWMAVLFALVFGLFGVYLLLPVIAAVACALGRDFRYPFMGNRLARYLGYDPAQKNGDQIELTEDHEDCWVAAMGHFSVILPLWGMLAPFTAWILQGKRNFFLKFQSIQTLVYQACVALLYIGALFVHLFGFVLLFVAMGFTGELQFGSSSSMFGFAIFIVSSLIAFVIILLVPLLHILGQWAGYRVLKGDDYHYPLIGKLIERRMLKNADAIEENPA